MLPVLYGDDYVARVDMKFDTKTRTLTLINWWWEPGKSINDEMASALQLCMAEFVQYLGAENFKFDSDGLQALELQQVFKNLE